ncbi:cell wall-binding repeat-containing protein [Mycetocola sp. 2940]|uniref:cell wall-binding repeat-containing protein n=1 Tax=Mycetocola sp. 2940 TaxID=3156452 RepID=UPI0033940D1D
MRIALAFLLLPVLAFSAITAPAAPAAAADATIGSLLNQLVTAPAVTTGYDRAKFVHWIDEDGDGCDTRREVLIQESQIPVTPGASCSVTSGQWYSWYDGSTWTNPADVDIDHFVPLSEAWQSGAGAWTPDVRRAFANDLGLDVALEAVTDNVNQSKSDRDPSSWLPPLADTHCRYATDWVLVKYRWNLTVDTAERSALGSILSGACAATAVVVPAKGVAGGSETVKRLAGSDRYATAVRIAQEYAPDGNVVYIASGQNFPDALSAATAAAAQEGPLLLTLPDRLLETVKREIQRLAPATIVVAGGSTAVSDAVYQQLSELAPSIRRDAGSDRYETSRILTQNAFEAGTVSEAFFATGSNFPDALSASAAAGSVGGPLILVHGTAASVDQATQALISSLGISSAKVAGDVGVVSAGVASSLAATPGVTSVTRLAGGDRFATSSAINRASFATAPTVYFATGSGFADALAGAALAARDGAPLYVVPSDCVPSYVPTDLQALGTTQRVLLGSTAALSDAVGNLTVCVPPPPPTPPAPPAPPANPGNVVNCGDFSSWRAAQDWYDKYYPHYGDVAQLDGDNDGIACDSLR